MRIIIIMLATRTDIIDLLKRETPVRCDRRATHFSNLFNVACKRRQITTTGLSSECLTPGPLFAQGRASGATRQRALTLQLPWRR